MGLPTGRRPADGASRAKYYPCDPLLAYSPSRRARALLVLLVRLNTMDHFTDNLIGAAQLAGILGTAQAIFNDKTASYKAGAIFRYLNQGSTTLRNLHRARDYFMPTTVSKPRIGIWNKPTTARPVRGRFTRSRRPKRRSFATRRYIKGRTNSYRRYRRRKRYSY